MVSQTAATLPAAFDRLRVGIALYNVDDATIRDANDRLEALLGYTVCDLRGMPVERYTANTYGFSAEDFAERLRTAVEGEPQRFTWRVKRADGELVWTSVSLTQRGSDGDARALAEIRDITDYYTASRRETLFWRVLRHNLRNETNKIVGYAEQIRLAAATDGCRIADEDRRIADEETRRHVRDAAASVRSTAMDLGTVATSVKEIQQAAVQSKTDRSHRAATEAVRDVVAALDSTYPNATVRVEERRSMWVHVDAAFDHALRHAIENAIRHGDGSDPVVEVTVGPSPNTGRVEIRVADRNPLIPQTEIDALDEFADLTSTRHGTGVGLFVMKWCIESIGGELAFERREPRGNLVRLYLPARDSPHGVTGDEMR